MRIFLDANFLFSAAKSDGPIRRLLDEALQAGHECWVDGFVVEEARRNLAAKAPDRVAALDRLLRRLRRSETQTDDEALERTLPVPEKDRPVLMAAIRFRCAALVTGDRTHFGPLFGRTIGGVTIHSPRSLAEILFDS